MNSLYVALDFYKHYDMKQKLSIFFRAFNRKREIDKVLHTEIFYSTLLFYFFEESKKYEFKINEN